MYDTLARALRVAGGITICGMILANLQFTAGGADSRSDRSGELVTVAVTGPPATTTLATVPARAVVRAPRLVVPTIDEPREDSAAGPTTTAEPTTSSTTAVPSPVATFELPPGPSTGAPTDDSGRPEQVGTEALDLVSYPWRDALPGWQVRFLPGRRGLLGATWPEERRIDLYVRDAHTVADVAHVVAHELGHAIDVTLFDEADRAAWRSARGFATDRAWFGGAGESDYATPSGDFAESFAVSQVGPVRYRGVAAGPPTTAQLGVLAELIAG